jgi:hypothetical protein
LSAFADIGVHRSIFIRICFGGNNMRKFRLMYNSAIVILIWNSSSALATVYNSDGSSTNIQYIHDNLAVNGDTIVIPAGGFAWTGTLSLSKAITLQGAGVGQTLVTGGSVNWDYRSTTNGLVRVTGIETNGTLWSFTGRNDINVNFRFDHNKLTITGHPQMGWNTLIGVIDHNQFFHDGFMWEINDSYWNGDPLGDGDYCYAAPTDLGSGDFLFIEDNTFICTVTNSTTPIIDSTHGGSRFVLRHNVLYDSQVNTHGTESSRRHRGGRAVEIYNNQFIGTTRTNDILGQLRSGVNIVHDNTFTGWSTNGPAHWDLAAYHASSYDDPWQSGDGTNPWDVNVPGVFDSGTVSASSGVTVTDSTKSWAPNQWAGYTIRNASQSGHHGSNILSNTATSITFAVGHDTNLSFASGDTYEIRKVQQVIDGPGRAGGSLIQNQSPTPPPNWNDQVTEPCYSWNNTDEHGASVGFGVSQAGRNVIRQGEHYFNGIPMPGYEPYVYPHPLTQQDGTPTPGPTATPTATPTPRPSLTPSPTATAKPSPTPTSPPSPTPTATTPPTPSPQPTSTPTATATPTTTVTPIPPPPPALVQHLASAIDIFPVADAVSFPAPNPSLAGNTLLLTVQLNAVGSITGVTDDKGNSWSLVASLTNTTYSKKMYLFMAQNVAAGTTIVKAHFTGVSTNQNRAVPQGALTEFYNVGDVDAVATSTNSTTTSPLTTTMDGDLIYEWGASLSTTDNSIHTIGGTYNGTNISAGAGFTLLSADLQVGSCDQYQIQQSAGTITPTFTPSGNATWGAIAVALKPSPAGTAPSGMRIVHVQHTLVSSISTQNRPNPIPIQFPSSGNLIVGQFNSTFHAITNVTDSLGNTWSTPPLAMTHGGVGNTTAQIIYSANANTSPNLSNITITTAGANTFGDDMLVLHDIVGASASPFDVGATSGGNQTVNAPLTIATITPLHTGIVFAVGSWNHHTANEIVSPVGALYDMVVNDFDDDGPGGTGTTPSTLDMDNPYGHFFNVGTSQLSFTFDYNHSKSTAQGADSWGGAAGAFAAETQSTPTPTPTPSATMTPTPIPSPSPTPVVSPSPVPSPTPTPIPTATATATIPPSPSPSPTSTATATPTATPTPKHTPRPHPSRGPG